MKCTYRLRHYLELPYRFANGTETDKFSSATTIKREET